MAGVKLPTGYYFGVSAATGELTDNHDILSMRLFELDSSDVSILVLFENFEIKAIGFGT